MKENKLKPEEFTVSRSKAATFLGVSYRLIMKLDLPFFRVGNGLIKFRQADLDEIRENSIHNSGGAKA